MLLRPRQEQLVGNVVSALREHGNTLAVAPTGAGKTVMLSAATARVLADDSMAPGGRALILQHRDELVAQNRRTFHALNKGAVSGVVDAGAKDFQRPVVFAMVQTLAGEKNLAAMAAPDIVVVDEAHHAAASSYRRIIARAKDLNPKAMICGVTATPNRGDKKGLRGIFSNVADQITLGELIAAGFLVKPRTFVVDIGVQSELRDVRRTPSDFDMDEVARIMDKEVLNDAVVRHWKEKAGDRRTVAFCSTVAHAQHTVDAFKAAGVQAAVIHGDMPEAQRRNVLAAFDRGSPADPQVIANVAVLTEGWDCPPVSCVILQRPSSFKSTMIQMVGRGLRTVDPERYPGILKTDCIVLDFGISTLTHGSLEQDINLDGGKASKGQAPKKSCPDCGAQVPIAATECAVCGYEFPPPPKTDDAGVLTEFHMTEVELLKQSPFRWEDLWEDGSAMCATAFDAWAVMIFFNGQWHGFGGGQTAMRHLAMGERIQVLAMCDDYMREHESGDAAAKSKRWLRLPATPKQLRMLGIACGESDWEAKEASTLHGLTRYRAACKLTWKFNERGVKSKLGVN